jgi:hypothetical protein
MGFQVARRQIDDQSFDFAQAAGLQLCGYHLNVPAQEQRRLRIQFIECAFNKACEVATKDALVFHGRQFRGLHQLSPFLALG